MNLDQAFTFGQDQLNKQAKHPRISKKSPFYCIVKPTSSQQTQRKKGPTIFEIHDKENLDYQTGQQKHKRNPTDLNLIRFDTSPHSQGENSTNSRVVHNPSKCYRRLSFNTPNQTLRTQLPPVNNNGDKYKKIAQQMKELIQKQKYYYEIGDYEHIEFIYEQLDQLCLQL